jgi:hypothetical protein
MRTAPQPCEAHSRPSLRCVWAWNWLGWRACCGFASVHHLPRPTARVLPAGHRRRASCPYVLAASLQVSNGMMVLLGAARFGPPRNASERPTLRGASTYSARDSCSSRNDMMLLYIIHVPTNKVCEPSPSKGVERRGGVSLSVLSRQLLAGGRMVTSDVWVTLPQSCFTAVCGQPLRWVRSERVRRLGGAAVTLAAADG